MSTTAAFNRGELDCYQDRCENVPFASVGGLDKRSEMIAPSYAAELGQSYAAAYLAGYRARALELFGNEWETCEFSWRAAVTLPGAAEDSLPTNLTRVDINRVDFQPFGPVAWRSPTHRSEPRWKKNRE